MAAITIGKLIVSAVLLLLLFPSAIYLSTEYGNPAITQNTIAAYNQFNNSFNSSVYHPFVNNVSTGLNSSNQLQSSSTTLGFALAFILPGLFNVIKIMVSSPILEFNFLNIIFSSFGIAGIQAQFISTMLIVLVNLFVFSIGVSLWEKYPLWSAM